MAKCEQGNGTAHSPDLIRVNDNAWRCGKHQQAVQALADKISRMTQYPQGQKFSRAGSDYVVMGHSAAGHPYVFNLSTEESEGVYR